MLFTSGRRSSCKMSDEAISGTEIIVGGYAARDDQLKAAGMVVTLPDRQVASVFRARAVASDVPGRRASDSESGSRGLRTLGFNKAKPER